MRGLGWGVGGQVLQANLKQLKLNGDTFMAVFIP